MKSDVQEGYMFHSCSNQLLPIFSYIINFTSQERHKEIDKTPARSV
jgi:hypothetical protein